MSKIKKEKIRNPKVSIKAIAIDEGYYKNKIVRAGESFFFEGEFEKNSEGEFVLPSWMEPSSHAELEKLSKAASDSVKKGKAPAAKASAEKPANDNATSVMASAPELV